MGPLPPTGPAAAIATSSPKSPAGNPHYLAALPPPGRTLIRPPDLGKKGVARLAGNLAGTVFFVGVDAGAVGQGRRAQAQARGGVWAMPSPGAALSVGVVSSPTAATTGDLVGRESDARVVFTRESGGRDGVHAAPPDPAHSRFSFSVR